MELELPSAAARRRSRERSRSASGELPILPGAGDVAAAAWAAYAAAADASGGGHGGSNGLRAGSSNGSGGNGLRAASFSPTKSPTRKHRPPIPELPAASPPKGASARRLPGCCLSAWMIVHSSA